MSLTIAAEKQVGKTMEAWVLQEGGDINAVKKVNVEIPEPAEGQLRVKVHASSINPVDFKRAHFGPFGATFPAVHGTDGAGVVDAVGAGVSNVKVGDKVHFWNNVFAAFGTYAEFTLVSASAVVPIPEGVSFEVAAAAPCAAWTAYEALFDRMNIQKGKWIYIAAGAGGVGHYAIQLAAKVAGAKVITSASGANVERLQKEGNATLVIDYKKANVKEEILKATNNVGVDYMFDMLGDEQAKEAILAVKFAGQYTQIATDTPATEPSHFFRALTTHHVFIPGHHFHPETMVRFVEIGAEVAKLIANGTLVTDISATAGFDEVLARLQDQAAGHVRGKVVVRHV